MANITDLSSESVDPKIQENERKQLFKESSEQSELAITFSP